MPKVDPDERLKPNRVYTLSFYSQYVDFGEKLFSLLMFFFLVYCAHIALAENWNIVRVPGMRGVELSTFWAESPLHVVAYSLPKDCKVHDKTKRRVLLDVELMHESLAGYPKKK